MFNYTALSSSFVEQTYLQSDSGYNIGGAHLLFTQLHYTLSRNNTVIFVCFLLSCSPTLGEIQADPRPLCTFRTQSYILACQV